VFKLLRGFHLKGAPILDFQQASGGIRQKLLSKIFRIKQAWNQSSKFTIHPFKSLHSKHLLPLSLTDYFARFSLELLVLSIASLAIFINFFVNNHAIYPSSSNQSVIFSFIKANPSLNHTLAMNAETTTFSGNDQLVSPNPRSLFSVALASTQIDNSTYHTDPTTIQDDVILKTNPADTENFARHGLTTYQVVSGDTIIGIASSFGISPQTIMMENKIDENTILRPGQELTILPTTGITYTLKTGDTLESILSKYKISEDDFLDANNIELFDDLGIGSIVVIPQNTVNLPVKATPKFVRDSSNQVALKEAQAPADFVNSAVSFIWPTNVRSLTQGFHSRHRGLDISNSKTESIYAAADGFVEISGFQSNGYGNTIIINHGNGYKTRYAHASALYVTAGEYVTQGQTIAKQGRTGRVRGVTGIHLHFEIIKNGVQVNPLLYVRP